MENLQCIRCGDALDTEESRETGICPGCWVAEDEDDVECDSCGVPESEGCNCICKCCGEFNDSPEHSICTDCFIEIDDREAEQLLDKYRREVAEQRHGPTIRVYRTDNTSGVKVVTKWGDLPFDWSDKDFQPKPKPSTGSHGFPGFNL